jgi:citrate lyase subunit beta/citryl-CoA lyase
VIGRARSWLYVPAHRPELLDKAMAGPADAIVYDLEDAVPRQEKEAARANAASAATRPYPKPLWVRINAADTTWGRADIAALAETGVAGVRVPKCTDPVTVRCVADRLGAPVHLLAESAVGVENAFALARAHPQVAAVSLGEADLLADLRARDTSALEWARQRIIVANRAAGLPSPPHAAWTNIRDVEGLLADSESARDRGFFGRSVLHPSQIVPVNQAFTPSRAETEQARRLLDSLAEHASEGTTAWIDEAGRFVDPAVVARSRWLVELADHLEDAAPAGRSTP